MKAVFLLLCLGLAGQLNAQQLQPAVIKLADDSLAKFITNINYYERRGTDSLYMQLLIVNNNTRTEASTVPASSPTHSFLIGKGKPETPENISLYTVGPFFDLKIRNILTTANSFIISFENRTSDKRKVNKLIIGTDGLKLE